MQEGQHIETKSIVTRARSIAVAGVLTLLAAVIASPAGAATADPLYFGGLQLGDSGPAPDQLTNDTKALFATQDATADYSHAATITGVLKLDTGVALANKFIQVSLDPGPALFAAAEAGTKDAISVPLGSGTTDSSGAFATPIRPLMAAGIGPWLQDDGGVQLMFSSAGKDYSLLYQMPVLLPRAVGGLVRSKAEDDPVLDPAQVAAYDAQFSGQGETDAPDDGGGIIATNLTLTAVSPGTHNGTAVSQPDSSFTPSYRCQQLAGFPVEIIGYRWVRGSTVYRGYVPIQRLQTASRTNELYDWANNKNTTTYVGIDLQYNGTTATGGYSHSTVTSSGDSWTAGHNIIHQVELDYDFRYYTLQCFTGNGSGGWQNAGVRELKPYTWTSGDRQVSYYSFTCNPAFKVSISAGAKPWVAQAGSYTRAAGLSVQGFRLNTSSKNGTSWREQFHNVSSTTAHLCGENTYPSSTPRAGEVNS